LNKRLGPMILKIDQSNQIKSALVFESQFFPILPDFSPRRPASKLSKQNDDRDDRDHRDIPDCHEQSIEP